VNLRQFKEKTHLFATFLSFAGPLALIFTLACSSPSSRERIEKVRSSAHHHYAADGMDTFWLDYRSPEDRPVQHWQFYYKHCALGGNKPFYDRAEYMCTEPY
jgi:hypothetical protein